MIQKNQIIEMTLGELLFFQNEKVKRNATGILRELQRQRQAELAKELKAQSKSLLEPRASKFELFLSRLLESSSKNSC